MPVRLEKDLLKHHCDIFMLQIRSLQLRKMRKNKNFTENNFYDFKPLFRLELYKWV